MLVADFKSNRVFGTIWEGMGQIRSNPIVGGASLAKQMARLGVIVDKYRGNTKLLLGLLKWLFSSSTPLPWLALLQQLVEGTQQSEGICNKLLIAVEQA